jgi:hypothetical protein
VPAVGAALHPRRAKASAAPSRAAAAVAGAAIGVDAERARLNVRRLCSIRSTRWASPSCLRHRPPWGLSNGARGGR